MPMPVSATSISAWQPAAMTKVERDQAAPFGGAALEELLIARTPHPLSGDRGHVVTRAGDQLGRAAAEILVELEPHPAGVGST
jgi:hypothetical protein